MRPAVIVDTETTGLDPERHEIWELALLWPETGVEHVWRMRPDLAKADPSALRVGQFYARTEGMCRTCRPDRPRDLVTLKDGDDGEWSEPESLAAYVARRLDGATLVAANPAFDSGFLSAFLKVHGEAPTWHYRMRDIGSMAAGFLMKGYKRALVSEGLIPEIPAFDASTDEYAMALGVDISRFERHSALGDCRLVKAMFDAIQGGGL